MHPFPDPHLHPVIRVVAVVRQGLARQGRAHLAQPAGTLHSASPKVPNEDRRVPSAPDAARGPARPYQAQGRAGPGSEQEPALPAPPRAQRCTPLCPNEY